MNKTPLYEINEANSLVIFNCDHKQEIKRKMHTLLKEALAKFKGSVYMDITCENRLLYKEEGVGNEVKILSLHLDTLLPGGVYYEGKHLRDDIKIGKTEVKYEFRGIYEYCK